MVAMGPPPCTRVIVPAGSSSQQKISFSAFVGEANQVQKLGVTFSEFFEFAFLKDFITVHVAVLSEVRFGIPAALRGKGPARGRAQRDN